MKAHQNVQCFANTDVNIADHVFCNNCMHQILVDCGTDVCPLCGKEGVMVWFSNDPEYNEVVISDFYNEEIDTTIDK